MGSANPAPWRELNRESIELPDFLRFPGKKRLLCRRKPGSLVTEYDVATEGYNELGAVEVFDIGFERLGYDSKPGKPPVNINDLVGKRGAKMLEKITGYRKTEAEGYTPNVGSNMTVADTLGEGRIGISVAGVRLVGDPEGYRKHFLVGDRWLDLRVPGDEEDTFNINPDGFYASVEVYKGFLDNGLMPPMACPLMLVRLPANYSNRLYGETRESGFAARYIVLEHLEGRRLVRGGRPSPSLDGTVDQGYVDKVVDENGLDPYELLREMVTTPLKVLSIAHERGIMLPSNHYGNYMLCRDGRTRSVADFGGLARVENQRKGVRKVMIETDIQHMAEHLGNFERALDIKVDAPWMDYSLDTEKMRKAVSIARRRP